EPRTTMIRYLRGLPAPQPWDDWLAAEAPIRMVYRESPNPLKAYPDGSVSEENPPPTVPGMVLVALDGHGKLLSFAASPYRDATGLSPPVTAETVFQAAGLDKSTFSEIEPTMVPS